MKNTYQKLKDKYKGFLSTEKEIRPHTTNDLLNTLEKTRVVTDLPYWAFSKLREIVLDYDKTVDFNSASFIHSYFND